MRKLFQKTHAVKNWRGNMEQQRQHAAIRMELMVHFEKHYFYKKPMETGTDIRYNIKHARKQPELLDKHIQEKQLHINT